MFFLDHIRVQTISITMAFSFFFSSILVVLVIIKCLNADDQGKTYKGHIHNSSYQIQIIEMKSDRSFCSHFVNNAHSYSKLLVAQQYIIDKTLLIDALFKCESGVKLITYGRRWGKTTNVNMIKEFVEIELDKNYKIKPQQETKAYKFFKLGKLKVNKEEISVSPPLISEKKGLCDAHLATYPVIHISFADQIEFTSYDSFLGMFGNLIATLFEEHLYIMKKLIKLSTSENTFKAKVASKDLRIFNSLYHKNAEVFELKTSLRTLSKLLYEYHGKEVFIFVDEYDTIYNKLFLDVESEFTNKDANSIKDFITTLMTSTFKMNPYLKQGIITGISRIAKENMFSGLNVVHELSIFSPEVNLFYGIMKEELELLLELYPHTAGEKSAIYSKYDGYPIQQEFFNTSALNTFAVTRYLCSRKLEDFWYDSGNMLGLFKPFLYEDHFRDKIRYLLLTTNASITITFNTLNSDIDTFIAMKNYGKEKTSDPILATEMLKLLLSTSYLCGRKMKNSLYELTIPNEEIKTRIHEIVLHFYIQQRLKSYEMELEELELNFKSLVLGKDPDLEGFKEKMNSYLKTIPAQFGRPYKNYPWEEEILFVNEQLYHDIMTSVALLLHPKRMGVNFRYGKNNFRPDIFLGWEHHIVVIEMKYGTRENDYKALNQCKSYRTDLENLLKVKDTTPFRYIVIRGFENKTVDAILDEEKHSIRKVLETIKCTHEMKKQELLYLTYKKSEKLDIIHKNNVTTWTAMKETGERGLIDINHCKPQKEVHDINKEEVKKSSDNLPEPLQTSEDAQPPSTQHECNHQKS